MYIAGEHESLYCAINEMKEFIKQRNAAYDTIQFKGVNLTVSADSNPDDIAVIFNLKNHIKELEARLTNI